MTVSAGYPRGDLMSCNCPSRSVLKHVTSQWGFLVLIGLEAGTLRFSAIRRMVGGVSERMLAQTLRNLEHDGLVDRVAFDVVPPHVEYSLTPLGVGAAAKVRELADWIEGSLPAMAATWSAQAADSAPRVGSVAEIARRS